MKFDVILANPPYNLANKMLAKYFEIGSEICTVQPSTWLLGKQQKKDIVKHVDTWDYSNIESINGNEFFDANIGGVMAIQMFKENNSINHNRHYIMFDGKEYNKCNDISSISNDTLLIEFKKIIEPLYLKDNILNHIKYNPKVTQGIDKKQHYEKSPNLNWYVIQLPRVRGNKNKETCQYKDDFYTLISNNKKFISTNVLGIYKNLNPLYYLYFTDKNECLNAFKYIQTYFVRTCLYLVKNNIELLNNNHTNFIPWFNFSAPAFSNSIENIDLYLFKKYNISQDIVNHILEILPNYYNLDLSKYKNIKVES